MGAKKNGDDGKKKEDSSSVVFKIDIHCEGCANKIRKCVREIEGVEKVKAEWEINKLTVIGKFDASKLREKLADKTKKKIDIVSSSSEKKKEKDEKAEDKKAEEKKPKEKETPVTTATLKVELHCQGCIQKIYKVVSRTKGVEDMAIERQKDLVMVKGKMDVKALIQNLEEKLKRKVAVVVPKKDKDDGAKGGDAADNNKTAGDAAQQPTTGGGITEGNRPDYAAVPVQGYGYGYGYGYGPGGYVGQHLPSPQMFSDENPNACSVM
ncbi:heavy metal-associated isoprenylated plant protein 3-like [Momordica charantia]|uniref:Heavy metal-associated isoprenylated plant protein 3-like n=1 Tax=Momordica charantia TaxID=3673 RepID=A0A6J1CGH5_MOMCH|nr:heavy metal-associated isoprenylated plant protein 3-like [Momordica charantia]